MYNTYIPQKYDGGIWLGTSCICMTVTLHKTNQLIFYQQIKGCVEVGMRMAKRNEHDRNIKVYSCLYYKYFIFQKNLYMVRI
jgi:hypothetical protein